MKKQALIQAYYARGGAYTMAPPTGRYQERRAEPLADADAGAGSNATKKAENVRKSHKKRAEKQKKKKVKGKE